MMNAREKAEDLVNQYRMLLMNEDTECGNEILCTLIAVESAKITCNEMIKHIKTSADYGLFRLNYWKDVFNELENENQFGVARNQEKENEKSTYNTKSLA